MAQRDLVRAGVAKLLALERRGGTCEVSHYGESRREGGGGGEDESIQFGRNYLIVFYY